MFAPRPTTRPRPTALAVLLLAAAWCEPCGAASGGLHRTDDGRIVGATRVPATLQMTTDVQWVDGWGYRPVRITLTPLAPVVADRTLTVEFLVRRNWREEYSLLVRGDVEIPAGSGAVEATLAVPQHVGWNAYRMDVFDDGRFSKTLSINNWVQSPSVSHQYEFPECLPAVLVVGAKLPDTSRMAAALPVHEFQAGVAMPVPGPGSGRQPFPNAVSQPAGKLPERWIEYSNLDVVCLSLDELLALRKNDPAAFRAALDWTSAGGNLWVYGVGDRWPRIGELEGLVGLPPGAADNSGDPPQRGWRVPGCKQYGRPGEAP